MITRSETDIDVEFMAECSPYSKGELCALIRDHILRKTVKPEHVVTKGLGVVSKAVGSLGRGIRRQALEKRSIMWRMVVV